jgi:crotonobetainyl-CoA:carnitine CoA-transferase CaiB-like acyl-CoA transferase
MKPLTGVTVLDLSRVLAGPLCAQGLADLGANVIKIETVQDGDESRTWPPFHRGVATAFITANRNKKSVAVNLKHPEGLRIVRQLTKTSDVVIESAATGASQRLGVDYESLRKLNDRLIYCTISGFGRTGPLKDMRGYDMILQAYSGMMSVTGDDRSGPVRIPFSPIDQTTGYHAMIGVLAALIRRGASGEGAYVEVSLFETAVSFLGYMIQAYLENGTLPGRSGSEHGGIVPYQAFACVDKPVLIGVANDKLWRKFCDEFQFPELSNDPRFALNRDRVANRAATIKVVQDAVATLSAKELVRRLTAIGVPCSPINNFDDILNDPHTIARGLIRSFDSSKMDPSMKAVMMPIVFDGQSRDVGDAPPLLGEHTDQILSALGFSDEHLLALERDGAIFRAPPPNGQ